MLKNNKVRTLKVLLQQAESYNTMNQTYLSSLYYAIFWHRTQVTIASFRYKTKWIRHPQDKRATTE